ncbi:hypothetical protein ACHAWO_001394 [Cyclotella atomus]|uniref:Cyclin C-terminal domain-containing protein n=1 Tax=Cyclotella atomus TaxID=382360 RepID=A0ABD3QN33_9STRA
MSYTELISQIRVMHQQERSAAYRLSDYIKGHQCHLASDREALCDWGYQTIAACNGVSRSTAVVAISYFDRFLGTSTTAAQLALTDPYDFQLAFVTCLVIALKVHSGFHVETDFVSDVICKNMYPTQEIIYMELQVLQALEWKLNGPTPHDFIDYYLEVVPSIGTAHRKFLIRFSKALVELALPKYSLALHHPSELAFVSICCAMQCAEFDATDRLSVIQLISSLHHDNRELGALFPSMMRLMHECLHEPRIQHVTTSQAEGEEGSILSEQSLVSVTHNK